MNIYPRQIMFKVSSLFLLILICVSSSAAQSASPARTQTEEWVQSQVDRGLDADLANMPNKDWPRELSSSFLVQLLTSIDKDSKTQRNVIQIFNAVISQPFVLKNLDIHYGLKFSHCTFKGDVDFSRSNFSRSLAMSDDNFEGMVNFSFARINGTLDFGSSNFLSDKPANFDSIKVGENVSLTKATFAGMTNFVNSDIKGTLQADSAHFKNVKELTSFSSMKVGYNALIRQATFDGPTRFIGTNVTGIFDLSRTRFTNNQPASSNGNQPLLNFQSLKVDTIKLEDTYFASEPRFDGLSYQSIYMGERSKIGNDLLINFPGQCEYNAGLYSQLEDFLRKSGNPEDADQLYINRKWREQKENLSGFARLGNLLFYALVGYGRRPWLALIYGSIVVIIGYFVFHDKNKMEPKKEDAQARHYSPFWYSLDLFAPVINLESSSFWMPKQERRFARNYMNIQRILGWVLVPLGIVAWTGLVN